MEWLHSGLIIIIRTDLVNTWHVSRQRLFHIGTAGCLLLDISLLSPFQRVINLDAQVSDGAF